MNYQRDMLSDIYSLGILMHEISSGQIPYDKYLINEDECDQNNKNDKNDKNSRSNVSDNGNNKKKGTHAWRERILITV